MLNKFSLFSLFFILQLSATHVLAKNDDPIKVVTSFSILENLVDELGGDHVDIVTLVSRDGDSHTYRPKPSDNIALSKADLVVTNGMGFEGWMSRLIQSSGFKKHHLVASQGVEVLLGDHHAHHDEKHTEEHHDDHDEKHDDEHHDEHDKKHDDEHHDDHDKKHEDDHHDEHDKKHDDELHDEHDKKHDDDHHDDHDKKHDDEHHDEHDEHQELESEIDPHAWHSFKNIRVYIKNITQTLIEIKPEYTQEFEQRQKAFLNKIDQTHHRLKQQINTIPVKDRIVVTSHESLGYLGREFSIQFMAPVGLSTEMEPSARDVANLIDLIKDKKVNALFLDSINNPKTLSLIAEESGVTIGGRLYTDALSSKEGSAKNYIAMMRHNVESIINALKKSK